MKIAIATKNLGKLKEFQELSKGTDYELIPIPEDIKELPPETGETFYENALIKAKFISEVLGIPAIGDDSGLEVDVLNGEPGVYSARYSDSGRDEDNCIKLLKSLEGIEAPQRVARFKCCLVGFGYDPIFITKDGLHLAELEKDQKNLISHRSAAFTVLMKEIPFLAD